MTWNDGPHAPEQRRPIAVATVGEQQPRGERGAVMADTVGKAAR